MEILKNTNFDFLGKKVPFLVLSLVLIGAGAVSLIVKGGPRYGIDFKGGTRMSIKFAAEPQEDRIRQALATRLQGEVLVQRILGSNEVIVDTEMRDAKEMESVRQNVNEALGAAFGQSGGGKPNFHGMGADVLANQLAESLQRAGVTLSTEQIQELARQIAAYRDTPPRSGLISSFDDLKNVPGVTPAVIAAMKQDFSLAPFLIRSFEKVYPKIGEELRQQAINATLFALAGMLIYIALRFEFVYGLAAVLAVFHDTIVTIGLFSIFNKEISLTVVAALLTLVGYSMNDTVVIFDRVRENLRAKHKGSLEQIINLSINQTLSRTILTSGLTFLTVLALWLFGGQTLNGFSFCLVVGILVGTYSTVFIASPIVIWWHQLMDGRRRGAVAPAPAKEAQKAPAPKREKSKAVR